MKWKKDDLFLYQALDWWRHEAELVWPSSMTSGTFMPILVLVPECAAFDRYLCLIKPTKNFQEFLLSFLRILELLPLPNNRIFSEKRYLILQTLIRQQIVTSKERQIIGWQTIYLLQKSVVLQLLTLSAIILLLPLSSVSSMLWEIPSEIPSVE